MQVARLGAFDLVFCRNALIYFGQESKAGVLDRLARQIEPDGYLVLGAAETVVGLTGRFRPHPDHRGPPDLESMFLVEMLKRFLQQNRPEAAIPHDPSGARSPSVLPANPAICYRLAFRS